MELVAYTVEEACDSVGPIAGKDEVNEEQAELASEVLVSGEEDEREYEGVVIEGYIEVEGAKGVC